MDGIGGTHHAVFSHYQRYSASTQYGVVREATGGTDANIGWASGKADTSSITTHKGAGAAYLKQWDNQVSGKLNAIQTAAPTRQPQLLLDATTSLYWPFYDPALFTNMQTSSAYVMAAELDFYIVVRLDPLAPTGIQNYILDSHANLSRQFLRKISSNLFSLDTPQSYANVGTITALGMTQFTARSSAVAANCLIRKNGVAQTMLAQSAITNILSGLTIGGTSPVGTGSNWYGQIMEIIITSRLSDTDRDTIEAQLIADYAI